MEAQRCVKLTGTNRPIDLFRIFSNTQTSFVTIKNNNNIDKNIENDNKNDMNNDMNNENSNFSLSFSNKVSSLPGDY